jgi:hypothetical protein
MESQLVRDGYKILSDVALRSRYDAKLAADEAGAGMGVGVEGDEVREGPGAEPEAKKPKA